MLGLVILWSVVVVTSAVAYVLGHRRGSAVYRQRWREALELQTDDEEVNEEFATFPQDDWHPLLAPTVRGTRPIQGEVYLYLTHPNHKETVGIRSIKVLNRGAMRQAKIDGIRAARSLRSA